MAMGLLSEQMNLDPIITWRDLLVHDKAGEILDIFTTSLVRDCVVLVFQYLNLGWDFNSVRNPLPVDFVDLGSQVNRKIACSFDIFLMLRCNLPPFVLGLSRVVWDEEFHPIVAWSFRFD